MYNEGSADSSVTSAVQNSNSFTVFKRVFGLPHGRRERPRPVTHDGTQQSTERPSAVKNRPFTYS